MKESEITGHVYDKNKDPLPGAIVTLEGLTESLTRTTVTNAEGHYAFKELSPGQYKVTASMIGFNTASQKIFTQLGQTEELDFILTVDEISEAG